MLRPLASPNTWRRWAHLILGGALLMPYWLAMSVLAQVLAPGPADLTVWMILLLTVAVIVPLLATALIPGVRALEVTAARELLGATGLVTAPPAGWRERWRTAGWFAAHLGVGGVISGISLALPPFALVLVALPFGSLTTPLGFFQGGPGAWWAAPLGLALLVALVYLAAAAGAGLARLAPVLLGPSAAEKLALLRRRAEQLAERNRLARELHDSVGHALSVVAVQAAAAVRVLDTDPGFARTALGAIAETARGALTDLDYVLGVLREDPAAVTPQRTLDDLDRLLDATRLAGVDVAVERHGELDTVPAAVSREAYRIVQEGLTNALRHAGQVPVTVRLTVADQRLRLELSNPLPPGHGGDAGGRGPTGGGRGLTGGGRGLTGIAERVAVLGGEVGAGPASGAGGAGVRGAWRLGVMLPLEASRPPRRNP